jgi:predicted nuclease of predicted toxin-antitoxin system
VSGAVLRALANENVPGPVVDVLRRLGHDVAWIKEDSPGASDPDVLARAQIEGRVVLTFDKGFGMLAHASRLPAACGIVLFRLTGRSPDIDNRRAIAALVSRDDWGGQFAIVEDDRIRTRPIPS